MKQRRSILPLCAGILLMIGGADWRQFRGPHSSGVAPEESGIFNPAGNVAWKIDLPGRGLSGPIVVGERVFLTASSGDKQDRLHVLAFAASTGKKLWQRTVWATGPTDSHPKTCMAAPTPASDGQRIIALFGTNDLLCLNLNGDVLWMRALYEENPGATDGRGLAASPIIAGSTVVAHVENQNASFAEGVDIETGKTRWHIDCPREMNWTSPIVLPGTTPASDLVLLQGTTRLSACDPLTGREVWRLSQGGHPIASCARDGRILYVPAGDKLAAFALQPDAAPPKLLWEQSKLGPAMASPVVSDGRVYSLRGSILACGDTRSGLVLSQLRLKGEFSSSPVISGERLYCFNEKGMSYMIKLDGKEPIIETTANLEDTILCTPAIANGALYVRSDRHLWKIGKSG
ncbi:MAG TPA: PQQ-binding-like beta-propeller repeat protein [Gemmataceae bacterium]|nr:PQQ-binding-like beta-propeller repeat protein [Gemmataceae bacterium]